MPAPKPVWVGALAGLVVTLLPPPARGQGGGSRDLAGAADAVAFVRVFGDVSIDATDDWEGPAVLEDRELATGSAFVIAPSGLLLTNHHVVSGGPESVTYQGIRFEVDLRVRRVEVSLPRQGGHETFEASVVGTDEELDLAALQVTAAGLPYLLLGDSGTILPGQAMTVLGFPFGRAVDLGRAETPEGVPAATVTRGSFSAARPDEEGTTRFLQTDATVHPGSSGGPMLDDEGLVVGVVAAKLVHPDDPQGPAFGIPVELAKEFLAARGVLFQVPGTPLGPGVIHDLDYKGLRVRLPEGAFDQSEERLRIDTGDSGGPVSFLAVRVHTPGELEALEKALLKGRVVPGFLPGTVAASRRLPSPGGRRLHGSAGGTSRAGEPFRLEYALVDVGSGNEKLLARFLGHPEDVAFNLGLLRRSLEELEVEPLIRNPVRVPLEGTFETAALDGQGGEIVLPASWTREPTTAAGCVRVPAAQQGVATRPPGDFTVVMRALRWSGGDIDPRAVAQACGRPPGTPPLAYARRFRKLGVDTGIWGAFRVREGGVVLLEVETQQSKLALVRDLYLEWLARIPE